MKSKHAIHVDVRRWEDAGAFQAYCYKCHWEGRWIPITKGNKAQGEAIEEGDQHLKSEKDARRREVRAQQSLTASEMDQLSTDAAWARGFGACPSAVNTDMAAAWDQGWNAATRICSEANPYRAARTPSPHRPAMDVLKASDNVTPAALDGRS